MLHDEQPLIDVKIVFTDGEVVYRQGVRVHFRWNGNSVGVYPVEPTVLYTHRGWRPKAIHSAVLLFDDSKIGEILFPTGLLKRGDTIKW